MINKKKKIVFVNSVIGIGSTGKICVDLADKYKKKGYDVKIAYGRGDCDDKYKKYAIRVGNNFDVYWHVLMTRIFDRHGLCSINATKKFIKWLDEYKPDELWLHNIHGYYINYEILFNWIKKQEKLKVKWTLHDCWAFTGHCSYYTYNKCYKWKKECEECKYFKDYPKCIFFENSKDNFRRKKDSFLNVKNIEIITPSLWLKNEVKKSFLKKYDVKVIHNVIDTKIFKPTKSNLREKLGLKNKFVILAVANIWNDRKGYKDLIDLDGKLSQNDVLIIVGLNDEQILSINNTSGTHIIPIKRTNNQIELAKYYSIANVFINPTHEDNYPTVNLEAKACGIPIITRDVGGCVETIN